LILGSQEECERLLDEFAVEYNYRCLGSDKLNVHGELSVRGDSIFMLSMKSDLYGVVIQSQPMADTLKSLFNLAWEGAK
jgi:hypothetical protein